MGSSALAATGSMGLVEAVRQMPAAVEILDAAGQGGYANPRAVALGDAVEILHLDERRYDHDELPAVRTMTTGEPVVDEEYLHVRGDGRRLVIRCSASAVRNDAGTIVGGVLVRVDVTDDKRDAERLSYFDRLLDNTEDAIVGTDADFRVNIWNTGAERLYGYTAEEAIGRHAREIATYVGDESREQLEGDLRDAARARVELTAHRKDDTSVEVEIVVAAVCDEHDAVVGYLGVHRDITERNRVAAEHETRARQQAVIASLGIEALGGADPQTVMDEAVAAVARTLNVEIASVAELFPEREEFLLRAGIGWRDGAVGRATSAAGRGSMVGYAVMTGEPAVSEDLRADDRFAVSPVLAAHRAVSGLAVVIAGREGPLGALGAFARHARSFTADDVTFMQSVANVVSVAFETGRAERRLLEVRQAERVRIARDLHDEALQGLTAAIAETIRRSPGGRPAPHDELVNGLKRVGLGLRAAIYDLRLGEEESWPFAERLTMLVAVHAERAADVDITPDIPDAIPNVPGRRGTEVLRVVGEALTNARRHSGASRVRVRASAPGDVLRVEVSDNGRGFSPERAAPGLGSAGLRGARERADLLGARLSIDTQVGRGTSVRIDLPLDADETLAGPVRILLVEDHVTVREALAGMIERESGLVVVGQAGSVAEARGMLAGVDVALVDLGLPDGSGDDLIPELHDASPRADALVLSAGLDRAKVASAIRKGAAGSLDKTAQLADVVEAVRRLRAGETLMPLAEVVELLSFDRRRREQEHLEHAAIASLTPRELEVLQALGDGLDSRGIARRLQITHRTERNHVANILHKLGVHSRLEAIVLCVRHGAVEIS